MASDKILNNLKTIILKKELSPIERIMLIYLMTNSGANVTYTIMALRLGISRATIAKSLTSLETSGLLSVHKIVGKATKYETRLNFD